MPTNNNGGEELAINGPLQENEIFFTQPLTGIINAPQWTFAEILRGAQAHPGGPLRARDRGLRKMKRPKSTDPSPMKGRINCRACGALNVEGCEVCKCCKSHCRCVPCVACSAKKGINLLGLTRGEVTKLKPVTHPASMYCGSCGYCKRGVYVELNQFKLEEKFCKCRKMPKWMPTHSPKGSELLYNSLPRPLGLEIELCDLGSWGQTCKEWTKKPPNLTIQIEHDGSVSGAGSEAVVSPLVGDQFFEGAIWLSKYFNTIGARVDRSCGFHVHVGAQDYGPFEIRRLLSLYYSVEEEIYARLLAPHRSRPSDHTGKWYNKKYDMPAKWWRELWKCGTSTQIREYLAQWIFTGLITPSRQGTKLVYTDMPDAKAGKYRVNTRYYGLNIHSWFHRGTIEWRHKEGTLDPGDLLYWPLFCGWMTQLGSALKDDEARSIRTLRDLVEGEWKRPFLTVGLPKQIKSWLNNQIKSGKETV